MKPLSRLWSFEAVTRQNDLVDNMSMLRCAKIFDHAVVSGFGAIDYVIYLGKQLSRHHLLYPPNGGVRTSTVRASFLILSVLPHKAPHTFGQHLSMHVDLINGSAPKIINSDLRIGLFTQFKICKGAHKPTTRGFADPLTAPYG
jgi:hypothetical protein